MILVTRSSMPDFEEYTNEIKDIWQTHWLTNMGAKHQELQKELIEYLEWYNEKRIKVKLKGLPPLQFRNQSLKSAWLKSPIIWM